MHTALPSTDHYHYLPGGFQYAAAVMARPGHALERARFSRLVPLAEGFRRLQAHLAAQGLPPSALCACELRSPAVMSEADFATFNQAYVQPLAAMGLYQQGVNPVARCNLIPADQTLGEPCFHAFSYAVPTAHRTAVPDFVTSGAAECPDRPGYRDNIVRLGDTSPAALGDKLRYALGDLESRFKALGVSWAEVTEMDLYTVHDLHHLIAQELAPRRALSGGLCWHWVRPPVADIEIEIDARRVSRSVLLPA